MKKTGRVLRIEKTSIHDGEGLRTVVFLKGCPLRCKWCSTPESQHMDIEYGYGVDMTVEQVIKEVCKDEIFFFHSGGGMTLSGGEVLLQADFAREVLKECRYHGIHTAIETSLYAKFEEIEKLLPFLDTIYVDIKMMQEERHAFYTGVSNRLILENLMRVDAVFEGEIHIRIPSIPTVNLYEEEMRQIRRFVKQMKRVKDIELLPYHRLGLETYQRMHKVYELHDVEVPDQEMLYAMAKILQEESPSCPVKIRGEWFT